ncbi:MAG: phosphatase PAP2 family protein [Candidatus Cloacimonadaceae bacterium]|jgi:membrane-associated phospholipid phosphatase|nr:phosphatase PAP2 family protein [Candidatus Cloacimonadota bacterium]MDX9949443.1 phosphatase PAP2 family protein [Candidatus Syntrophosphaera sp.]
MPEQLVVRKKKTAGFSFSFSAIDKITLAYCAWIVVYMTIGIFLGRVEHAEKHLPGHLLVAGLVLVMAWAEKNLDLSNKTILNQALRFIHEVYPIVLFAYFYGSLHAVARIIFPDWLDPWFMELDHKIFGYYPSLVWGQKLNHWLTQEVFHFAYFCYYPMIAGLPVYFYLKNKPAFKELIFNLTFVFYCCYIFYSLIPVVGARIHTDALTLSQTYRGGVFTRIMALIYNRSNHWGGAFPSSHIAIALVLTIAALKHTPKMGYVFAFITFFLSIATVYCHYHWFVDALAGVFTGISGWFVGSWARLKLERSVA